jgi:hypothetical protein
LILGVDAGVDSRHHFHLLLRGGIAHDLFEQEPVGLRLGQRIGTFLVDGVLGGDHHERLPDGVHLPGDGGLSFLHCFEHRALGLRARSVDFIEQQDIGVHWTQLGDERTGGRLVDLRADDVAGQQVRRALDAMKAAVDRPGKHLCGGGLRQTGHALE